MSLQPTRWYASRAAAERGEDADATLYRGWGAGERWWFVCGGLVDRIDVTGRSLRHIDRLARDWIAFGVGPTVDGRRGVSTVPSACSCTPYPRRRPSGIVPFHDLDCARIRWDRAEACARRVVRR